MSVSLSPSEVPPVVWPIVLNGIAAVYIHVSAIALLLYDILLTMGRETRQIWTRRHAATTVLYSVARYSSVLGHLAVLLVGTTWRGQNIQTCSALYWIGSLSTALSLLAIACFSAVRVFVLSSKCYWSSLVVLILGLYPSAMYLYFPTVTTSTTRDPSIGGCSLSNSLSLTVYRKMAMSTRIASIAADLPALLVTLRHTYRTFVSGRQRLSHILLVDGSVYFGALLLFSLAEVFFLALAIPNPPQHALELEAVLSDYLVSVSEALADFVTTLNVVLMCRFLLHLCEASEADPNRTTPSVFTSVSFASGMLMGNDSEGDERELMVFERGIITARG